MGKWPANVPTSFVVIIRGEHSTPRPLDNRLMPVVVEVVQLEAVIMLRAAVQRMLFSLI